MLEQFIYAGRLVLNRRLTGTRPARRKRKARQGGK